MPGTNWKYSNSGYTLIGKIIETISRKSYEIFIQEKIFKPLDMSHTYLAEDLKIIKEKPGLSDKAYMGLVMKEFKGRVSGKDAMEIIKKHVK